MNGAGEDVYLVVVFAVKLESRATRYRPDNVCVKASASASMCSKF